jgi:hypothetical protein
MFILFMLDLFLSNSNNVKPREFSRKLGSERANDLKSIAIPIDLFVLLLH